MPAPDLAVSRRSLLTAAAAAPALAIGAGAVAGAPAALAADPARWTMVEGLAFVKDPTGRLIVELPELRSFDFRFTSTAVGTYPPSLRVMVPEGYATSTRTYPVLVLLHGFGGNFKDWTDAGGVQAATAGKDVIVVMPDGGSSFYVNAQYDRVSRYRWDDYVIGQILPFVHANFRTDPSRMAIAGLSMGGFGALTLGQKHAELFRSISSYSGPGRVDNPGVELAMWACPSLDWKFVPGARTNLPGAIWGNWPYSARRFDADPIRQAERYRGKRLFLRTGDGILPDLTKLYGNTIELVVRDTLDALSGTLTRKGIAHDYRVDPGVSHEWPFWQRCLVEDLPGMLETLNG
ncbi:esterase family protein [Brachybacterium sp. JHP9]|uniref:Acyl-CoA:diacylglycerol acyltransferase n=1 Tax=Brachybacterium equifaecis TaxID=2910770 RepID=A0ABT0QXT2_9MICO|nr:alpha/beta hydrolase family protein [Brachybacterium equifaecis]MCL6422492.1 esterase family protein [Brachybacterium equifaecis]